MARHIVIRIQSMPEIQCEAVHGTNPVHGELSTNRPADYTALPTCSSKQKLLDRKIPSRLTTSTCSKLLIGRLFIKCLRPGHLKTISFVLLRLIIILVAEAQFLILINSSLIPTAELPGTRRLVSSA